MATQEHLYGERERCPFFDKKRSPHVFLIVLKFGACHECPPAGVNRDAWSEIVLLGERREAEPQANFQASRSHQALGRITARPLALPAACE